MARRRGTYLSLTALLVTASVVPCSPALAAEAFPLLEVITSLSDWSARFPAEQTAFQDFSSVAPGPLSVPPGLNGYALSSTGGGLQAELTVTIDANPEGYTFIGSETGDRFMQVRLCTPSSTSCGSGTNLLSFTFSQPVNGFIADWDSPATAGGLNFTVSGVTTSFKSQFTGTSGGVLGVVSPTPFDTVTFGLDDPSSLESFRVDDIAVGIVPLPSALPLLASALGGLSLLGLGRRLKG